MEMIKFLEADREKLYQSLVEAGTPDQAETVLENEIDRLLLLYNENCVSESERDAALQMMQAAKSMIPLICANAQPKIWERSGYTAVDNSGKNAKGQMGALAWLSLIAGAVLCIGAVVAIMMTADAPIALAVYLKAMPLAIIGCALSFLSGKLSMNPGGDGKGGSKGFLGGLFGGSKGNSQENAAPAVPEEQERRIEMRIDPDKIWTCMRAMVLVVDRNVQDVTDRIAAEQRAQRETTGGNISSKEVMLLSDLLELAYSLRLQQNTPGGAGLSLSAGAAGFFQGSQKAQAAAKVQGEMQVQAAEEMIDDIKFYLHDKDVKVVNYGTEEQKNHRDWFERLPAPAGGAMTLRPALVQDGRLLRKGMVAAED